MAVQLDLASLHSRLAALELEVALIKPAERASLRNVSVAAIAADAAFLMGLTVRDIVSASLEWRYVRARDAIAWVAHRATDYSLVRIAVSIGRTDHSTVFTALRRADTRRTKDEAFRLLTDRLLDAALKRRESAGEAS